MKLQHFVIPIVTCIGLSGCGSSSSGDTAPTPQPPVVTPPETPVVIEDISCSPSYGLPIHQAFLSSNNVNIDTLFDTQKTANSSWLAPALDASVVIELERPSQVKALVITWADTQNIHQFDIYASKDSEEWELLDTTTQSNQDTLIPDVIALSGDTDNASTAVYLRIDLKGTDTSEPSEIIEVEAFGCRQEASHNIELIDWYMSVPTDVDNNGKSDSIKEDDLADGYFDPRFFNLTEDGGIAFATSVSGYRTSTNTKYVRSELREMLRRGNTAYSTQGVNGNNWVFSSAPQQDLDNAGGIDGELHAELSVNHVTSTGEDYQIGRVIIGQIHANDDEPARLYYRKLPDNENGAIYLAHELLDGDDTYYEIIGSRSNTADNPEDGIPLNERFSYSIIVEGNDLEVSITKEDGTTYSQLVDMSDSGYDEGNQYMYFKAGVYNQNNSGDQHDYVKATFYKIDNSHTGYQE